jgi:hypothetical protein
LLLNPLKVEQKELEKMVKLKEKMEKKEKN